MERERRGKPWWVQVLVTSALLVVVAAGYIAALRATLDEDPLEGDADSARDTIYLAIHGGVLAGSTLAGVAAGKWLNGLGLAYGVLILSTTLILMVAAQAGAYTLACEADRNDLIRHWTCE